MSRPVRMTLLVAAAAVVVVLAGAFVFRAAHTFDVLEETNGDWRPLQQLQAARAPNRLELQAGSLGCIGIPAPSVSQ